MLEKLTGRKKALLQRAYCPDCETRTLLKGPEGGLCRNVKCSTCGAEFNVGPVSAERIVPDAVKM
jgi:LSD1 subclass zinc finger protein